MNKIRCSWVTDDPLYIQYHDEEWGRTDKLHQDNYLFEMLTLEGAQAGLSWLTILKRRENYRQAFDYFNPEIVAHYNDKKKEELLLNEGIIRNRRKIESTINNAQAVLNIQEGFGSFHQFLALFFDGKRIINHWQTNAEVPAQTEQSLQLSKQLKKRGFTFVGPVICYSFMQAIGIVDDHIADCFIKK